MDKIKRTGLRALDTLDILDIFNVCHNVYQCMLTRSLAMSRGEANASLWICPEGYSPSPWHGAGACRLGTKSDHEFCATEASGISGNWKPVTVCQQFDETPCRPGRANSMPLMQDSQSKFQKRQVVWLILFHLVIDAVNENSQDQTSREAWFEWEISCFPSKLARTAELRENQETHQCHIANFWV